MDEAGLFTPPSRSAYIRHQRDAYGRRVFGVFPGYYPRELLWALNILPVEIWDPPLPPQRAAAHLQPYICPVAKLGLELITGRLGGNLDGLLFPHLCDSLQNLASLSSHYLDLHVPVHFFYAPKAEDAPSARAYFLRRLEILADRLAEGGVPLDMEELERRVRQGRALVDGLRDLYACRAEGRLALSNAAFYRFTRQNEYLHPDDFIPRLEAFREAFAGSAGNGPGILLSGILPNPPEVLDFLDHLGIRVVNDDLLNGGRRLPAQGNAPAPDHPLEELAKRYFALPPCSTGTRPLAERAAHLLRMAEAGGARGVIFWLVKFCEPEAFDLPPLRAALKDRGIPSLLIETALNEGLSGQMATRLEAFAEMIS